MQVDCCNETGHVYQLICKWTIIVWNVPILHKCVLVEPYFVSVLVYILLVDLVHALQLFQVVDSDSIDVPLIL